MASTHGRNTNAPETTLSDFLLARIAEDEAAANAAHLESMRGHAGPGFARSRVAWTAQAEGMRGHALIERFTPARVLVECAAKRRIVERYVDKAYIEGPIPSNTYDLALFHVMCDLATVYADHPDYREEWRP